jgi:preprotein translocase subunit SecE
MRSTWSRKRLDSVFGGTALDRENMATSQVQTVVSPLDKVKLAGVVLLVVGALVAYYLLAKQGSLAQWGALIVGLAAAAGVFFVSEPGRELFAFGRDSAREVRKVVWPSRKEAIQMTAYVFGFVALMAVFLWLTDKTLEWVLYDLVLGWRK